MGKGNRYKFKLSSPKKLRKKEEKNKAKSAKKTRASIGSKYHIQQKHVNHLKSVQLNVQAARKLDDVSLSAEILEFNKKGCHCKHRHCKQCCLLDLYTKKGEKGEESTDMAKLVETVRFCREILHPKQPLERKVFLKEAFMLTVLDKDEDAADCGGAGGADDGHELQGGRLTHTWDFTDAVGGTVGCAASWAFIYGFTDHEMKEMSKLARGKTSTHFRHKSYSDSTIHPYDLTMGAYINSHNILDSAMDTNACGCDGK